MLNGGKKSPLLNQYLFHRLFPIREASEYEPCLAHHHVGSGRKQNAGAGSVLSANLLKQTPPWPLHLILNHRSKENAGW